LNETQGACVGDEGLPGEHDRPFLEGLDLHSLGKVLLEPIEVVIGDGGEGRLEESLVFGGDLEVLDELPDGFEAGEDGVFSAKGVFPKEDLKGGLILMFVSLEIGEGAGELVKVVVEHIDLAADFSLHCFL
jgi:hypothetical protein